MLDKIKAIVMVLRLMFRVISLAVHVALPCVSGDSLFKATSPLILEILGSVLFLESAVSVFVYCLAWPFIYFQKGYFITTLPSRKPSN